MNEVPAPVVVVGEVEGGFAIFERRQVVHPHPPGPVVAVYARAVGLPYRTAEAAASDAELVLLRET